MHATADFLQRHGAALDHGNTGVGFQSALALVEAQPPLSAPAGELKDGSGSTGGGGALTGMAVEQAGEERPRVLCNQGPLCVLWKPPGWTVSVQTTEAGAGTWTDGEGDREESTATGSSSTSASTGSQTTLSEAERRSGRGRGTAERLQDWLVQQFGATYKIVHDSGVSHGLLNRLDRETSGAVLWASSYSGFYAAQLQLAIQHFCKEYVCLCHGHVAAVPGFCFEGRLMPTAPPGGRLLEPPPAAATDAVAAPTTIGAGTATTVDARGQVSRTEVLAVGHLWGPGGCAVSLVEVRLHTGRRHQIRAHLSHEGHLLVGDPLYGATAADCDYLNRGRSFKLSPRLFLHASRLALHSGRHGGHTLAADVPLPADLRGALAALEPASSSAAALRTRWLQQ